MYDMDSILGVCALLFTTPLNIIFYIARVLSGEIYPVITKELLTQRKIDRLQVPYANSNDHLDDTRLHGKQVIAALT